LDFSGVTKDDLIAYAMDSLVIKWQSSIRRKKGSIIPTEATYKVPKPGTRASVDTAAVAHAARVQALKAMMPHLSDEDIEKYAGLLGTAEGAAAFQAAVKADGNN
jgi:hypothetical protein